MIELKYLKPRIGERSMKRDIRLSEKFLVLGYILILLFMIVQDLIPLGALNDIEAIASVESFNETIVTTLIGTVQIILILTGVLLFMGKKYPLLVKIWRSEEHTSELQSRGHLVCRLLLEKKKYDNKE